MTEEKPKKLIRTPFKILLVLLVLLFLSDFWLKYTHTGTFSGKGFSDKEINRLQQKIKEEIEKSSKVEVSDVFLIKVSPMHLEGYVNFSFPSGEKYQQVCTARKGENLKVLWRCVSEE